MSNGNGGDRSAAERALDEAMLAAIEADGFDAAFEANVQELIDIRDKAGLGHRELGRLLHGWVQKDPELKAQFDRLSDDDRAAIDAELAGEIELAEAHDFLGDEIHGLGGLEVEEHPEIYEADGSPMMTYSERVFQNWGLTVKNRPAFTFIPRTKAGVCNIVKWANQNGRRVRCSGYRHTWESFYGEEDQVLISLLPLKFVEKLPAIEPRRHPANELQEITFLEEIDEGGKRKGLCRIGAGVTNEMFREWCLGQDLGGGRDNWRDWTVPLNVIMVEITYGGSNAPICHGAGWTTQTLSDLVHEIEFVNAKGELQTVSDPELLKTAAGCFGLLGVVTALTLKLEPMTYAKMFPLKRRLVETIPPPKDFEVPHQVDMDDFTEIQYDEAWADFVARCETHYYVEWFWFVWQKKCWINSWVNDGDKAKAVDYPSEAETARQQRAETTAEKMINSRIYKSLSGEAQGKILAHFAMKALPSGEEITTPLIDALHFQRGIQNMRVQNMEIEIPIPARADDPTQPDWRLPQRAWWDLIRVFYDWDKENHPLRLTIEMRITRDSNIHLAPQNGNTLGTCAIEFLTNMNTSQKDWTAFCQAVADVWDSYKDADGKRLNVRPHWAKQWRGLEFRGMPAAQYLREVAYQDRIVDFNAGLVAIADAGGYDPAEAWARFSNPLLDDLFR